MTSRVLPSKLRKGDRVMIKPYLSGESCSASFVKRENRESVFKYDDIDGQHGGDENGFVTLSDYYVSRRCYQE